MVPSKRLSSRREYRRKESLDHAMGTWNPFSMQCALDRKEVRENWLHPDCRFYLDYCVLVSVTIRSASLFRLLVLPQMCIEIVGIAHRTTLCTLFTTEIRIFDVASLPPHRPCSIEATLSVRKKCLLSLPFFRK